MSECSSCSPVQTPLRNHSLFGRFTKVAPCTPPWMMTKARSASIALRSAVRPAPANSRLLAVWKANKWGADSCFDSLRDSIFISVLERRCYVVASLRQTANNLHQRPERRVVKSCRRFGIRLDASRPLRLRRRSALASAIRCRVADQCHHSQNPDSTRSADIAAAARSPPIIRES